MRTAMKKKTYDEKKSNDEKRHSRDRERIYNEEKKGRKSTSIETCSMDSIVPSNAATSPKNNGSLVSTAVVATVISPRENCN